MRHEEIETDTVLVWADGTWVYESDYSETEYSWMSDDFFKLEIELGSSCEEIEEQINQIINKKK